MTKYDYKKLQGCYIRVTNENLKEIYKFVEDSKIGSRHFLSNRILDYEVYLRNASNSLSIYINGKEIQYNTGFLGGNIKEIELKDLRLTLEDRLKQFKI
jgi:hypothetical protein